MKNCGGCHKDFMEKHPRATCCSKECYQKRYKAKRYLHTQFINFNGSTGTKGAIQELKVSADLLRKGYQVFRSVSPSSHCDLVRIDKKGVMERVEVRSAIKNNAGKLFVSKNGKYDIMASVFRNKIIYSHFYKEV